MWTNVHSASYTLKDGEAKDRLLGVPMVDGQTLRFTEYFSPGEVPQSNLSSKCFVPRNNNSNYIPFFGLKTSNFQCKTRVMSADSGNGHTAR